VRYLLKNGNIITPDQIFLGSILIKNSKISKIYDKADNLPLVREEETIDCTDCFIIPGIIDPHVHLRDFDQHHKESIDTCTKAAIENGVTMVIGMPNTIPRLNSINSIKDYINKIKETAVCDVGLYAVLPETDLSDYLRNLQKIGVFGIKIYPGDSPNLLNWNPLLQMWEDLKEEMNEYLGNLDEFIEKLDEYIRLNYPSSQFRENIAGWVDVIGMISKYHLHLLFHADIPLESKIREIRFKTFEGIHQSPLVSHSANHSKLQELLHIYFVFCLLRNCESKFIPSITFCHVSSIEAIHFIEKLNAKLLSCPIYFEITPHHTYLHQNIELDIPSYGKVLPPLRLQVDNREIQQFLNSSNHCQVFYGSDHAPHSLEEKKLDFDHAPPGFPNLDIYPKFILSRFLENGRDLRKFVLYSSYNPSQIYQIKNKGVINAGYDADLVVFREMQPYTISIESFHSKSRICPYPLEKITVQIEHVFLKGKKVPQTKGKYIARTYK